MLRVCAECQINHVRRLLLNRALERIYNDYVDTEYAIVAWMCGGDYVTDDKRARRRFDEVRVLVDRIWPISWNARQSKPMKTSAAKG